MAKNAFSIWARPQPDAILFVVATERDGLIRVVTAYPANQIRMRKFYVTQKDINNGAPKDP